MAKKDAANAKAAAKKGYENNKDTINNGAK